MIVWKRHLQIQNRDVEEREDLAWAVASPLTYKISKWINIIINIGCFLVVVYFFKFNLLVHAIAFILLDIVLCILDRLVFATIPSKHPANTKLEAAEKRLKKLERIVEKVKRRKDKLKYGGFFYELSVDEIRWLNDAIVCEKDFIATELEKIKKEEIKNDSKISKDYSNKKEYFVALQDKLTYFIQDKEYAFLKDICIEITKLIVLLDKKPIGYEMISHNLYLHLDELVLVLTKFSELDELQKSTYISDIKQVSEYLERNIEQLSKRISDLETEDIEISLAVLLKELSKGES